VPISDDEHFENYLKSFTPCEPRPLPHTGSERVLRRFLFPALAVSAMLVMLALLAWHFRNGAAHPSAKKVVNPERPAAVATPLTTRSADAALFHDSSIQAALDQMAFPLQSKPAATDEVSALQVLGEERP
jgi:hypothetical protein